VDATAAVSGDELFRTIPQMGDVLFNATSNANSSNTARGDVSSVNLRNLGVGNTLVLINGRRTVLHPTSRADEQLVPVFSYNSNAIPVAGIQRLEVLLDGAAALYGSDAVAGVVNTVISANFQGIAGEAQYGFAEGTHLRELHLNTVVGKNIGDRGNVTLIASYDNRSSLNALDQDFTASLDRRPLFAGTPFENALSLDQRRTDSPFASLGTTGAFVIRQGTTSLTSAAGLFHIQPSTNPGCRAQLGNGLCIDDGAISTSGEDRNLRYDWPASTNTSILPAVERINLFATARYELTPSLEIFGEGGYYDANSRSRQPAPGLLTPITVPATNFYNPFGPVTFANGQSNPNRLANINVPAQGIPIVLRNYILADVGPTIINIYNNQYRALAGLRFEAAGFQWETAALYSEARVRDVQNGISATLFQNQLALSTPDAYNPFNGGSLGNPSIGDTTPSSQAALDALRIRATRDSRTSLALADIQAKNSNLFQLPGGPLGVAAGLEFRRETVVDNRDDRVDGTTTFVDAVTGAVNQSDLINTSGSLDVRGVRTVKSAFAEFRVPLISPDLDVPLLYRAELQLAGRYEHYSDVGSVTKPKVAGFIEFVPGLRARGSYSEAFRAPNLEQVNTEKVLRSNTVQDYVFCEADLRAKRIATFANCGRTLSAISERAGNPNLKPETSTNWTVGAVFEPIFIPSKFGAFSFTIDYWKIRQQGIVGLAGITNAIALDYLKLVEGSSNPQVIRAAPTPDDVAAFQGTGLAPRGQIQLILDPYVNVLPQKVSGVDFGFSWQLRDTAIGSFRINANATHLKTFFRDPSPDVALLLAAREAGTINPATPLAEGGSLIRLNGRPKWKLSTTATWTLGEFQLGAFTQYTSSVLDTALADAAGLPFVVEDQLVGNLYGQWEVGAPGRSSMRFRVGVRNITNEKPPLASSGFLNTLYNAYPRYWYANVRLSY
jgi:outer membrane receptor protein involved in Fe transport